MRIPNDSTLSTWMALPNESRLFIQRWIEQLDDAVPIYWRVRPIPRNLIRSETNEIQTNKSGKRVLSNSIQLAGLVDEEWASMDKTLFQTWSADMLSMNTVESAEQFAQSLSFAGFGRETLYGAFHEFEKAETLVEGVRSVSAWHQERTNRRSFEVARPVAKLGLIPQGLDLTVHNEANPLPEAIAQRVASAVELGHTGVHRHWIVARFEANDPASALLLFDERWQRYLTRLLRPAKPATLDGTFVVVHDVFPPPAGRTIAFQARPRYGYPPPPRVSTALLDWLLAVAGKDRSLGLCLDHYLWASRCLLTTGSVREAFQNLLPLLDFAFECDAPVRGTASPFGRNIELGADAIAFLYVKNSFRYLDAHLRSKSYAYGHRSLAGGSSEDVYRLLTSDVAWKQSCESAAAWNELLHHRRTQFVSDLQDPVASMRRVRQFMRWDLGRVVRARHAFAHRGEPLTDDYLLAVAFELAFSALLIRGAAAHSGRSLGDVMGSVRSHSDSKAKLRQFQTLDRYGSVCLPTGSGDVVARIPAAVY